MLACLGQCPRPLPSLAWPQVAYPSGAGVGTSCAKKPFLMTKLWEHLWSGPPLWHSYGDQALSQGSPGEAPWVGRNIFIEADVRFSVQAHQFPESLALQQINISSSVTWGNTYPYTTKLLECGWEIMCMTLLTSSVTDLDIFVGTLQTGSGYHCD